MFRFFGLVSFPFCVSYEIHSLTHTLSLPFFLYLLLDRSTPSESPRTTIRYSGDSQMGYIQWNVRQLKFWFSGVYSSWFILFLFHILWGPSLLDGARSYLWVVRLPPGVELEAKCYPRDFSLILNVIVTQFSMWFILFLFHNLCVPSPLYGARSYLWVVQLPPDVELETKCYPWDLSPILNNIVTKLSSGITEILGDD